MNVKKRMMNREKKPKEYDAVLGINKPFSVDNLVLGKIKKGTTFEPNNRDDYYYKSRW